MSGRKAPSSPVRIVAWAWKSTWSVMPAMRTTFLSWISPHEPRTCGRLRALTSAPVSIRSRPSSVARRLEQLADRGMGRGAVALELLDLAADPLEVLGDRRDRLLDLGRAQPELALGRRVVGPARLGRELRDLLRRALEHVARDRLHLAAQLGATARQELDLLPRGALEIAEPVAVGGLHLLAQARRGGGIGDPGAALGVERPAGAALGGAGPEGREERGDERHREDGADDDHGCRVAGAPDDLTGMLRGGPRQDFPANGDPSPMASDDHLDHDPAAGADHGLPPHRFLRATIAAGELTLNPPLRGTITGGPASMTFARLAGVAIVDLRGSGVDDDELVATLPPNAPPLDRAARRVLADWAALVGYRRLWLADRVLDLDPPPPVGAVAVRCPTCTSEWADSSPGFWALVRENHHFPGFCPACGGSLPEWRPARRPSCRTPGHAASAPVAAGAL